METNADKRTISIAIIDSGIDISISDLSKYVKKSIGIRVNDTGEIYQEDFINPSHIHGTAIALTVRHICENIEIVSINILNERLCTGGRVLIYSIQQAISYRPDIIHMSLGTTKYIYRHRIKKLVNRAAKLGIIVVAAADNYGIKSYPAYLKGVVGVKGFKTSNYMQIAYKNGFFYAPFDVANIKGINELNTGFQMAGNSMSAAYITGHIAKLKYRNNKLDNADIIDFLRKKEGIN